MPQANAQIQSGPEGLKQPERAAGSGAPGRQLLIVPGLYDSAPGHWQEIWLHTLPGAAKVEQDDWERPTLGEWVAGLLAAVREHPGAVLVGHSLGCALIAHLARLNGGRGVAGALLVAPAEVNQSGPVGDRLAGFGPMPLGPLPFPSTVVASRNDPYVAFDRSRQFTRSWGAAFVDAGEVGHINIESGHGPWAEGEAILQDLQYRIDTFPARRDRPE
jgi:predicted alpha/beta hydrolase family esterase